MSFYIHEGYNQPLHDSLPFSSSFLADFKVLSGDGMPVLRLAMGCPSLEGFIKPPLSHPVSDWAQLNRAATIAFAAWTPLLLLAQL